MEVIFSYPGLVIIGVGVGLCHPRPTVFSNTLAMGVLEYREGMTCC